MPCMHTAARHKWQNQRTGLQPDVWTQAGAGNRRRRVPRVASCAKACLRDGYEVHLRRQLSSPARATTSPHLLDNPYFELIRHDMTFPLYVEVDEIYNLACPARPMPLPVRSRCRRSRPASTAPSICSGWRSGCRPTSCRPRPRRSMATRRCIRSRRTTGATSIRSARAPATTRASAAPKRCSSTITGSTASTSRWSRIFNTYGPRMHPHDGRVVSNFIVQALQGKPITIYGDGSQTRSFCYVDDLIDGFIRLMDAPDTVTGPVNIGNPGEFTIRQLAEIVIEMTGSRSEIVQMPLPQDDPTQRRPDITKARNCWAGNRPSRFGKGWRGRSPISRRSCRNGGYNGEAGTFRRRAVTRRRKYSTSLKSRPNVSQAA